MLYLASFTKFKHHNKLHNINHSSFQLNNIYNTTDTNVIYILSVLTEIKWPATDQPTPFLQVYSSTRGEMNVTTATTLVDGG
jgi:hypothetical protein